MISATPALAAARTSISKGAFCRPTVSGVIVALGTSNTRFIRLATVDVFPLMSVASTR